MAAASRSSAKLQSEELKDVYRVWLKDLYDDKPEKVLRKLGSKKKKLGGGRRAGRELRVQHAQQHTAASALKDVALKKADRAKLPALSAQIDKQVLHDSHRRRHQVLVDEANYSSVQYLHQPSWRPGLAFFQQLVRHVLQKCQDAGDANTSSGVVSNELTGFPLQIAPILLRIPLRRSESRLGVALLYCQEHNQDEHPVESNGGSASFVLHCRVYSRASIWRQHRDALLKIISNSSAEICTVKKRAEDLESRHNELQLLRSRQEVEQAMDELWTDNNKTDDNELDQDNDVLALQKYIPFKGASSGVSTFTSTSNTELRTERKAWIARCASRKRDKHSSTVWIISGGDPAVADSSSTDCQIVKCSIDQAWSEPRLLTSMCVMELEKILRIRFNELVVDLLQDTRGSWWLLQVKAFTLASIRPASAATMSSVSASSSLPNRTPRGLSRTQSAPTRFEAGIAPTPQWKKWRCAGRYCTTKRTSCNSSKLTNQQIDNVSGIEDEKEPFGYLTKKVLRSCEFYDDFVQQQDMSLAGGFTEFHSALAFHLQHRLPKRDRSQLYESQPLCTACLRRYHSLRQQWIKAVEVPESSTITSTRAGHGRKAINSKRFNEDPGQILPPPRKLPSLHLESVTSASLNGSYSVPILPVSTQSKSSKSQEHSVIVSKQPNYLDELAAMEEMLAEHELPSTLIKTTSNFQPSRIVGDAKATPTASFTSLSSKPPRRDDIFPKWDGVTRIEAMWQDLTMKPLERQLTDTGLCLNDCSGAKQGYNSISLQQELAKVDKVDTQTPDSNPLPSPQRAITGDTQKHFADASDQNATDARMKSETAHPVHVQQCRRVFEDEVYREELVNGALYALRSGKGNVCFVVAPHKQRTKEDEDELIEMSLRSLYIDVKQAIAATSDKFTSDLSLSSWPMRPKVWREASGCITVKLGPV